MENINKRILNHASQILQELDDSNIKDVSLYKYKDFDGAIRLHIEIETEPEMAFGESIDAKFAENIPVGDLYDLIAEPIKTTKSDAEKIYVIVDRFNGKLIGAYGSKQDAEHVSESIKTRTKIEEAGFFF